MQQVSHALDTEHRSSLELLGRVEQVFTRSAGAARSGDPDFTRLAGDFVRLIEQDIGRHFDFEEAELFPRMSDSGEADIARMLREEHDTIREVAAEILPLARAAAAGSIAEADFERLQRGVLELVERQVAHIQKESMALLPMLDDLLDDDTDRELAFSYACA